MLKRLYKDSISNVSLEAASHSLLKCGSPRTRRSRKRSAVKIDRLSRFLTLFLEISVAAVISLTITNALKLRVTISLALKVVIRTTEVVEVVEVVVAVAKVAKVETEEALNSLVLDPILSSKLHQCP